MWSDSELPVTSVSGDANSMVSQGARLVANSEERGFCYIEHA